MAYFSHPFNPGYRSYYGPSLEDPSQQPTYWTSYPQKAQVSTGSQLTGVLGFAATLGVLGGAGYLPAGQNKKVWDYYASFARGVEEYSPGKILRTFQVSHLLSPFETAVRNVELFISPTLLSNNQQYAEYLSKVVGKGSYQRLLQEGVSLRSGSLYWGQSQNVALKYASAIRASEFGGVSNIGAAYARRLGVKQLKGEIPLQHFFVSPQPRPDVLNPSIGGYQYQIIGGKSWLGHQYRKLGALGTEQVERFNRLLRAPVEMKPLSTVFGGVEKVLRNKFGIKHIFDVPQAGGLKMLGSLSLKYGVGLTALGLGYKTLDWAARRSDLLDETVFSEGITYGIGSVLAGTHIAAAEAAKATGLQSYAKKQEEIAPGSTSLTKLLAFPLMGAAGVSASLYGLKIKDMMELQYKRGIDAPTARNVAERQIQQWSRFGKFADNLGTLLTSEAGLYSRRDWVGKAMRMVSRQNVDGEVVFKALGRMTPAKFGGLLGAGLGLAAIAPFLPGALVPSEDPEKLRRIYSGQEDVRIKKGRWWEFGRSPFEGQRTDYYRPHMLALMKMRSRERGIWGPDEDEMSPVEKWYKSQFTYELEAKHYKDRPYPVSSLPFQDVPIIGPLLSATVGRWIKPELYMHLDEWMSDKGIKVQQPSFGARVATEIGQQPQGMPISPYSSSQIAGEQIYRVGTEMIGLTGFTAASIKEKLTGSQDWFDQQAQLESAYRISGYEREYWDKELGGLLGMSEAWRRLFPHRRRQIDLVNPIRNTMPEWLPGAGERGPDFLTGDPYTKVPMGELRLPGEGYVARYPELEGVEPSNYPLIHQFKILGDVASYTDKYQQSLGKVRAKRNSGDWTPEEEEIFQTTLEQVKSKRQRKEFAEYKYLSSMGDIIPGARQESSELMIAMNEAKKAGVKEPSLSEKFFGGYWELLSHNAETAFDQLTPISPGAKLVHQRTAVESYERDILYGTENAFWQHPIKDFVAPFSRLFAKSFGYGNIPSGAQSVRDIENTFDILNYVKYTRLSNMARISNDMAAVKEFESKKDETLFGVNPFTRNYTSLYRSLPRRERDYFQSFSEADTYEERERILEMVPENEKALYLARWKLAHADELKKAVKQGVLTEDQEEEASRQINRIFEEAKSEGFPSSKELFAEYLATKTPGETYGDWYRRTKLLSQAQNIPGPDWVGWHPSVDLEDIKLKLVKEIGEDPISMNLWPSRERELPYKPFIDEAAIEPLLEPEELSEAEIQTRVNRLLFTEEMRGQVATTHRGYTKQESTVNIDYEEDKTEEVEQQIKKVLS